MPPTAETENTLDLQPSLYAIQLLSLIGLADLNTTVMGIYIYTCVLPRYAGALITVDPGDCLAVDDETLLKTTDSDELYLCNV